MPKQTPVERPSDVFAGRLTEVRQKRRWSQQDMADRLAALGAPMDRATIARTEGRARGLSLDDSLLFAYALDVAPLHMFVPLDDSARVALTPKVVLRAPAARMWVRGQASLGSEGDDRVYRTEVPHAEWASAQSTGVRHLRGLVEELDAAVGSGDPATASNALQDIQDEVERLKSRAERGMGVD